MEQLWLIAGSATTIALTAGLAGQAVRRLMTAKHTQDAGAQSTEGQAVFLFEGTQLIDATQPAHDLLAALPQSDDWPRLASYIALRFPQALPELSALAPGERRVFLGRDAAGCAQMRLDAEQMGNRLRLALTVAAGSGLGSPDEVARSATLDQLLQARQTLERSPIPSWREDGAGTVIWANAAYRELLHSDPDSQPWPLPALFEGSTADKADPHRVCLRTKADQPERWFELHDCDIGEERMRFAIPADRTVRAENALREFVQTLSKTFADLPIGLAVFDRQRRLQVFNPALGDLTTLSAVFLSARPTLLDFLDRLRETRMMPEPKDYQNWRQRMVALEAAAASGYHCETWSLPGGQTYRVTGRPHPDGAVAFLFEDISAAMTLTRKFRGEIDMSHEILDTLDAAICVIGPDEEVALTNAAYRRLWPADDGVATHFNAALRLWRGDSTHQDWALLESAVLDGAPVGGFAAEALPHPSAGTLACQLMPLSGGRTLLRFEPGRQQATEAAAPLGSAARAARDLAALSRDRARLGARADASLVHTPGKASRIVLEGQPAN